jgi:DNA-binding CsgD family transcriptional regulator
VPEGNARVLTPREAKIAQLAREGLSNPEIGARLFISPPTAQYHLRKVFLKLNISAHERPHDGGESLSPTPVRKDLSGRCPVRRVVAPSAFANPIDADAIGSAHPCHEHLCPDPTPPHGFHSRTSGTPVVSDLTRRSHRSAPAPAEARPAVFAALRQTSTFRLRPSTPRWRA